MIEIENLRANIENTAILKGVNLKVLEGEIHAIMGPNGAGKSTLAKVLAGHPFYQVEGSVVFKGKDLLSLEVEERAHLGLFMSFQYPLEISGVTNFQFLFESANSVKKAKSESLFSEEEFTAVLDEKMKLLGITEEFKFRFLNENFSGGEKKRNEILQMAILQPELAILDETDSGLDIDAMKNVANHIKLLKEEHHSLILITHYQRLLEYITPDVVHVMIDGKIVHSGDCQLALELEKKGYDWLTKEAFLGA